MGKRIVVALGGNALGNNLPEQMAALKKAVLPIADLIESGFDVVLAHGNGPQVGMIKLAMDELSEQHADKYTTTPLSVCVAMSQGYIGYDLQNALREELLNRGIKKGVVSLITQVIVDAEDPAFDNPNKPIGRFLSEKEAEREKAAGHIVGEDAGRGIRRMVASPPPKAIVETPAIDALLKAGDIVIAGGGGGIPVTKEGNHLKGAPAVIDKDLVSALMASAIDADMLMILTAVDKVSINFGKPDQKDIDIMTVNEAEEYIKQGQFAPGSMLPKVEATVEFVKGGVAREALITRLEKAKEALDGKTGTRIVM